MQDYVCLFGHAVGRRMYEIYFIFYILLYL